PVEKKDIARVVKRSSLARAGTLDGAEPAEAPAHAEEPVSTRRGVAQPEARRDLVVRRHLDRERLGEASRESIDAALRRAIEDDSRTFGLRFGLRWRNGLLSVRVESNCGAQCHRGRY